MTDQIHEMPEQQAREAIELEKESAAEVLEEASQPEIEGTDIMKTLIFRDLPPLSDMWWGFHPQGFRRGLFMVLHVHMDESFSSSMFAVSAVCGTGDAWEKVSREWTAALEETNSRLIAQDRPIISRYHAADCNSARGEFKGWSKDEERALQEQLSSILESNRLECVGVAVERQEAIGLEPYMSLKGWHSLAFLIVLNEMRSYFRQRDIQLSIIHDRLHYSSTLLALFEQYRKTDLETAYQFISLVPQGWETCIPLQPADFFAFEIKKFGELNGLQRKTLSRICKSKDFGGRIKFYKRADLERMAARLQVFLDAANPDGEDWMED